MTWVQFAQSNIWGSSTFDRFIHPQRGSKQLQLMLEAQGFQVSLGFISVTVAFLLGLAVRPLKGYPDGATVTAVTEDRRTHQRTTGLGNEPHTDPGGSAWLGRAEWLSSRSLVQLLSV